MKAKFIEMYLELVNTFGTIEQLASYYRITRTEAAFAVKAGKKYFKRGLEAKRLKVK